jgi:hypothetical protein
MQVVPQISFAGLPESHGSMDLLWLWLDSENI